MLYLYLLIFTLFVPLLLTWDKTVKFYKQLKSLFLSIFVVSFIFIVWDVFFTKHGVWGFNSHYLLGLSLFKLPLEEILFFIVVPYACVFIHDTLNTYWPIVDSKVDRKAFIILLVILDIWLLKMSGYETYYTTSVTISLFVTIILMLRLKSENLAQLFRTYFIVLVPFLFVNSVLTGFFTENPIVWYNDVNNLSIRVGTIPLEDFIYNFSLIVPIILIRDKLQNKKK
jgi:lycopene cyclase domain-containing protein